MKRENTFMSDDKKTMINYTVWEPENEIKGIVQLTHGMTEYMRNYEETCEFLCRNDLLVIGHDQLGHGHSVSCPEELGYFKNKNSVDILINDMHTLMKKAKAKYPDAPYFLLGH
uniref:alpha/beta hydrolase n=1 Tax=uncultured Clostridium sp. TaxID=59620 RepID=UPI0025D9B78F